MSTGSSIGVCLLAHTLFDVFFRYACPYAGNKAKHNAKSLGQDIKDGAKSAAHSVEDGFSNVGNKLKFKGKKAEIEAHFRWFSSVFGKGMILKAKGKFSARCTRDCFEKPGRQQHVDSWRRSSSRGHPVWRR